jgi:hypothetical protein
VQPLLSVSRFRLSSAALALALVPALWADKHEDWLKERVKEVRESDTQGWKKIPWTASLLDARKASKAERVPVFLFTHDGNIETGRC